MKFAAGGFVPWHYKYVKDGMCGANCKHGGVETEWATVCALSGYNAYIDADACCIGAMANAAMYVRFDLLLRNTCMCVLVWKPLCVNVL